ncbi:MAG: AAA family ATPase [Opitutaceae bacterium]|nr:AAA family ATPase [Opitutaceae bacterium]
MLNTPHSAEECLVACTLDDNGASLAAAQVAGVSPDSFHGSATRIVFEVLTEMQRAGLPIDLPVLGEELQKRNLLDAIGGLPWLNEITNQTPTTARFRYYLDEVLDQQRDRALDAAGAQLSRAAKTRDPDVIGQAIAAVSVAAAPRTKAASLAEVAQAEEQRLHDEIAGRTPRGVFGFGLPRFDAYFGNVARGEFVVPAGRPGDGKTSLCWGAGVSAAMAGKRVLFFGLEMRAGQLLRVAAGQLSGVSPRDLDRVHDLDRADYFAALRKIGQCPTLSIYDSDRSLDAIVARVRSERIRGQIDVVIVDYLQRVVPPRGDHQATREQRVGQMSTAFKSLALEIDAPVIVAAQLNRQAESDNREPRMSDLRESGSIEADADRVLLLHKPNNGPDGVPQQPDAQTVHIHLIVDKNRSGPTGPTWLKMHRPTQRFAE